MIMKVASVRIAFILLCLIPTIACAQDSLNVRRVGQLNYWEIAQDVAIDGNYAYCATGNSGLSILDIADPTHPIQVGVCGGLGYAEAVSLSGDYSYVTESNGFHVVDISNPFAPFQVGLWETSAVSMWSLDIAENFAFALTEQGLELLNIADPHEPLHVRYLEQEVYDVAVVGNYLYAVGSLFYIRDITDPTTPVWLGSCTIEEPVRRVSISGNHAYVAGWYHFYVIDITNPALPAVTGTSSIMGFPVGVTSLGNYVYIAEGDNGSQIIDVTDPTAPTPIGHFESPGHATSIAVSQANAYIADGEEGLRILDISTPTSPTSIGWFDCVGTVEGIRVSGNYAYMACGVGGFRIADLSMVSNPVEIAVVDTGDAIADVEISNNYAYVLECSGTWHILDVGNPLAITAVGDVQIPEFSCDPYYPAPARIKKTGSYAYLMGRDMGFTIFSLSNPAIPVEIGYGNRAASDIAVFGHNAYLVAYAGAVQIFDITDPGTPLFVGTRLTPGLAKAIDISGHYAFIADGTGGIRVFDLSYEPLPEPIGHLDIPGNANSIAISGDYAFVTAGDSGLYVANISEPRTPRLTGHYTTSGSAQRVAVEGSMAYVAEMTSLGIYDCSAATSASENFIVHPSSFSLSAYPNPFNPTTTIRYDLPQSGPVQLSVYDILGRHVRTLFNGPQTAGSHTAQFDGSAFSSGIYFVRLTANQHETNQKIVLLK
jgi:hypothetical protein